MSDNKAIFEELLSEKRALTEALATASEELVAYKAIGTPAEIDEALDKILSVKEALKGTSITEINTLKEELGRYKELGSVETVEEALDRSYNLLVSYKELGTPAQVREALTESMTLIKEYKELGTPTEIGAVLESFESNLIESECDKIATKHNTSKSVVRKMYEGMGNFKLVSEVLGEAMATAPRKTAVEAIVESKSNKVPAGLKPAGVNESKTTLISRIGKTLL
jgi:hypothetical protein